MADKEYWQVVIERLKAKETAEEQRARARADAARELAEAALAIVPDALTWSPYRERFKRACEAYRRVR